MHDEEHSTSPALDPAATDETSDNARNGAAKRRDPNEPAAVVGLGASAGGVSLLQQFFSDMPAESGLAFVVVMHLSPDHESNLANIIQLRTSMAVTQVSEPVKVKPNHVYVIPPNHQLAFEDGMLRPVAPQQALGKRVTIDLFFRTLAQAYGQRALCVVLSGTDTDGSIGVKHIRAQGGVAIAQDPNEAEHDSMPLTAIATGMVDWVLPVSQMPAKLMEFVENENRMKLPPEIPEAGEADVKVGDAPGGETVSDETRSPGDESALGEVLTFLRGQTGHDFGHYKRATVLRRIARRLQVNSLETIPQYLEFLRRHPAEARALLQDLLIGVTHFFRDQESFAALEANIPQLFAGKDKDDHLRVWVAGCSTGEEAYSVAMLLCEYAERLAASPKIQVFASDIDEQAIQDARDGVYPSTIENDVSQERLRRFFAKDHGRYRVRKGLREKVLFAAHNILSDAPFSRLDLVSCRNLLIYLNTKAQGQVFDIFHFALRSGGLLFIGGSESTAAQGLFAAVDPKHRIYVRRSLPRPSWKLPLLPLRAGESGSRARTRMPRRTLPPLARRPVSEAGAKSDDAVFAGQERRAALFGELHLQLLEQYAPPSVVVNEEHEVVHLSAKAGKYLRLAAGEPSADLFRLIVPELQVELRTALFRASQGEELNVIGAPQTVHFDGRSETIVLQVRRVANAPSEKFYLILFQQKLDVPASEIEAPREEDATRVLENEIQHFKGQLAATVEQYEGSNEELKASNEELQAMNEEMRSATEELETSKEELQSVNEELTTVNNELKSSVEDLSRANTDLSNLMSSTDIGTVFLDRQLRVHRFTPSAQKIFNLLASDLGRPLSDITHKLHYETLLADCEQVLDRLVTIEREVPMEEGEVPMEEGKRWYLVRIAPYRTQEDRIAGVVATFIEISRRKRAEDDLRESEARLRLATSSAGVFIWEVDVRTRAQQNSENVAAVLGFPFGNNADENLHLVHPEDRAAARERYERALADEGSFDSECRFINPNNGEVIWARAQGHVVRDARGTAVSLIGITQNTTERRRSEAALAKSQERFRTVADNIPQLIWTNEPGGKADYFNRRWYEYTGLSYEESAGLGWQAIVHPDDAYRAIERWQQALETGEEFQIEYRLRRRDGDYRWHLERNVPLQDADGSVVGWFGSATDIEEVKQAEASQRTTEERFRLLVEGARDYAMFLLGPNSVITFWSKGAERIFGWTQEEAIGQKGELIFTPEDRAKGAVEKEIAVALAEGRAPDRRFHLRKDGERFWADGVLMRLNDDEGNLRGFAKVARDASDQRAIEDALRHARDEMERRVVERTRDLTATNEELERTMAQRQQLEKELLEISEREKRRIGEDLHDMVCQELTATALFLKTSATKVARESPVAAETLEESAQIVNRNVGLTRDLARGLQPAELKGAGLKHALRALADQACEGGNVKCHFKTGRGTRVTDDTIALHLYRVAQEAVKNALKHSGAKNILITLDHNPDNVCVSVQDDGKGFSPKRRSKGLGLHIMRYRANALGGELKIEKRKRGGMDITCIIPTRK